MPLSLRLITYYHLSVAYARDSRNTCVLIFPKKKSGYFIRSIFPSRKYGKYPQGIQSLRKPKSRRFLPRLFQRIPKKLQSKPPCRCLSLPSLQFSVAFSILPFGFACYSIVARFWFFLVCNFPACWFFIVSPYLFFHIPV